MPRRCRLFLLTLATFWHEMGYAFYRYDIWDIFPIFVFILDFGGDLAGMGWLGKLCFNVGKKYVNFVV